MPSVGRFDRWENASGVAYGPVLQAAYSFSDKPQAWQTGTSVQDKYVGGNEENRGRVWWTPEGFTVAIKPISPDSKFLLTGAASVCASTDNSYNIHWRVIRNGLQVGNGNAAQGVGYTWTAHGQVRQHAAAGYAGNFHAMWNFYDQPYTTDTLVYEFQILHTYSSNYWTYVNRENDMGWESPSSSHFTVMEIQA